MLCSQRKLKPLIAVGGLNSELQCSKHCTKVTHVMSQGSVSTHSTAQHSDLYSQKSLRWGFKHIES